jgi:hypothetical protein
MEGALRPKVSQYHGLNTDALTSSQNMSSMNSRMPTQNVKDSTLRRHGGQNIATNTSHSMFAYENAMAQQESKENYKTSEELEQELLRQAMVKTLRPKYVPPPKEMYHHTSPRLTERQQMEMEMYHQTVQSEKNNRMEMYRR